jgi:hypothetical protein
LKLLGASLLEDVLVGARFLARLPAFLRHPVSLDEARAVLHRRLEQREADFLALVRRAIYGNPANPYRQLLSLAGCEYGDLERLVNHDGVDGALHDLLQHGVYLTVDEFKGRRPVVRGSATFVVDPSRLRNPSSVAHVPVQSGGSRGRPTAVLLDLASIRDHAVNQLLVFSARGWTGCSHAVWTVPGGTPMRVLLRYAAAGAVPVRWFSPVDPASPDLHARYRWSARVMRWGSLLGGVPLPRLQYVPVDSPLQIARWMHGLLRSGGTPHLFLAPSPAARLSQAALEAGVDLRGAYFTLSGEPITGTRLAVIRRAGAEVAASYGAMEMGGPLGAGCLTPEAPDDVHVLHDTHALIQPGYNGAARGLPPLALLLSSLLPTAPFVFLNVSLGDQARVVRRRCGCLLEALGWTTHLEAIRSFEKLTAGGIAFLDTDVVRVLEEVLPARFGGGPTDYQLVEEEVENGRPCLRLLIHPAVGPLNPDEVAGAFLRAVSPGSGIERLAGLLWQGGHFLRIERRPPLTMASGKVLHLHVLPSPGWPEGREADHRLASPRDAGEQPAGE